MPSRNSSETPGGRGRPRRSSGGSFDARRSSPKKSSRNQKDKGESFPKRTDSRGSSRKFTDDRSSSKKVGWKKPFTDNSSPSKSEFSGKKDRSDEAPGSGKMHSSKGGRYSKFDKDSRSKRDETSSSKERPSSRGGSYSKFDKGFRGKRNETSGSGKDHSTARPRTSKFDKGFRSKRDETSGSGKERSTTRPRTSKFDKGFPSKRDETSGSEKDHSATRPRVSKFDKDFRGKRDETSGSEKDHSAKRPRYSKFDKQSSRPKREETSGPAKMYSPKGESKPKFEKEQFRKKTGGDEKHSASEAPLSGKIRLNKFIANSGVSSRREADDLITMGLISVNGVNITELGYKVNPNDEVRHEGKLLRREKPVYILMNKPKGFLTTTADPGERNTVMHLIANFVKERVYPVGRLDRNTTGLLLLTNDGDLAEKLMHPSYNVKKIYKVELDRPLTKGDAQKIVDGVRLEEGVAMVDELAIVSEDRKTVGIEIHIGWNRVIRRIFESLEYQVVKLDRSVYAGLTKKDLGRGEWRFLKSEELVILKHYK
ncbi:MAG TPA: pseudouridine synthase [Chryseolinea sp.]|nr:pseudouridine synthase [Chryseolinea sp.]